LKNHGWQSEEEVGSHGCASREQSRMIIRLARRPEEKCDPQASSKKNRRAENVQCFYQQISIDLRTRTFVFGE
jgi:hypothetical protein